jgi:hypothetical protein
MIVSPAETVDSVNVSTSNFDAEQGMAGGAAITVITKSGTNQFRGSAFAFYNNEKLNAKPYFATEKGPASAHIDGATLGGPIQRNRVFFFGAWEGQYQTTPQQFFFNVPPAALRAGDFSHAFNEDGSLQIIYDPTTGNPDGTGRTPFEGNIIPQSRIDAIARQIQDLYPQPNQPGSTAGGNVGGASIARNFSKSVPRKFDRNNYDLKINWNPSSAAQVWGKYSRMGANVKALTPYIGIDDRGNGDTTVNMETFGTTWTFSPTMVLDATFAAARMTHETVAGDAALGNFGLDTLHIPGTNGGRNFSSDPRYAGLPTISPGSLWSGGFDWIGNIDGWDPVQRDERTYALSTNLTKVQGAHELRFGYSLNRLWMNHWQPELGQGPRGLFETASNATALNGGAQTANALYNGYAAFLLGLVGHGGTSAQFETMTTREWQHGLYARDRWQVSNKLTVDLGLRYEYYPLMTRANRGIEKIPGANDLTSTRQLQSLNVQLGGDLGIKVSKTLIAPRLGAIYRINDETVFRTGYGITYNPLPFSRPLRGFYPLTLAADYFATEPYGFVTTFEQGIPDITGPDLSQGVIPLPNEYLMRTPSGDVSRSRIQSWNVAVERRLPYDVSVDVAYVGTAKSGGFADINANASDVPGGGAASQPFFNSLGRTNDVLLWGPITKSRYHSLQVAINRPFTRGLLLKGAYTLSRAKNETDDDGWDGLLWNAPSLRSRNYALAGYDRTHVFQMAFVYELPYKTLGGSGNKAARVVLGDWQINGIFSAVSGTPFTIFASGADLNMPGNAQTANLNGTYKVIGEHGDAGFYFDPTSFSQPTGTNLGNTGRNQFRGPGYWNQDFSLFRAFPIGEGGKRAEFRVEFFNLFNHARWGNPDNNVTSGTFGRTFDAGAVNAGRSSRDFGTGERQIRLGVRFQF